MKNKLTEDGNARQYQFSPFDRYPAEPDPLKEDKLEALIQEMQSDIRERMRNVLKSTKKAK